MEKKFKAGDYIKLIDYKRFEDYRRHINEKAKIIKIYDRENQCHIRWEDGETSIVFENPNKCPEIIYHCYNDVFYIYGKLKDLY